MFPKNSAGCGTFHFQPLCRRTAQNCEASCGLLPLLARMTAEGWECPFFQIRFDMSWANWVLTANSRKGLPEPLQSRCLVLDLPDLTRTQLRDFALTGGERRGLPKPSLSALDAVFEHEVWADHTLSLHTVSRMLDRAEALISRPVL